MEWLLWGLYHGIAVRDKRAHRESVERIERWHFETLIPSHAVYRLGEREGYAQEMAGVQIV